MKRILLVVLSLFAAITLMAGSASADSSRYFSDSDPFNLGVSANAPTQYSNSADLAKTFGSNAYDANVATSTNGVVIKQASSNTAHYKITARSHIGDWGPNPFVNDVYWDNSWALPNSADNWVVSVSPDGTSETECWEAKIVNNKLSCEWGAQTDPSGRSNSGFTPGSAPTGSGISRLAGVITQSDWDNGINHALNYGTPDNNGSHVYPATKTDGSGNGAMTEGDFIWMDKSGECANPSGLNTAQQRIYKALQNYGAFNVDNAETFGFASEAGATAPGGNGGGWLSMKALPWATCLHVGKVTKDGTPSPTPTPTTQSPTPTVSPTQSDDKLVAGNVCRASASDKRNWWSIANLGTNPVQYTSYVMYSGTRTNGPTGTIQPGQIVSLRTANGGGLHVAYDSTEATATSNAKITCG